MAIALVQSQHKDSGTGTATTVAFSALTATTAGTLLIAVIHARSASVTVSGLPAGWTVRATKGVTNGSVHLCELLPENNAGGVTAFTFTISALTGVSGNFGEFSGVLNPSAFDASLAANGATTALSVGPLTPAATGELAILGTTAITANAETWSAPGGANGSGWLQLATVLGTLNTAQASDYYALNAGTGATTATSTLGFAPTSNWEAILAFYKAAGAAVGTVIQSARVVRWRLASRSRAKPAIALEQAAVPVIIKALRQPRVMGNRRRMPTLPLPQAVVPSNPSFTDWWRVRRIVRVKTRRGRFIEPPWLQVVVTASFTSWPSRLRRPTNFLMRRPRARVSLADNGSLPIPIIRLRRAAPWLRRRQRIQIIGQVVAAVNPGFADWWRRRFQIKTYIRRGKRFEPGWGQAIRPPIQVGVVVIGDAAVDRIGLRDKPAKALLLQDTKVKVASLSDGFITSVGLQDKARGRVTLVDQID